MPPQSRIGSETPRTDEAIGQGGGSSYNAIVMRCERVIACSRELEIENGQMRGSVAIWQKLADERKEQIAAQSDLLTARSEKQSTEPERFEATDEFKQLASFYDVLDVAGLVRAQEERIEDMRKQLPPTPPFPGIQRAREG